MATLEQLIAILISDKQDQFARDLPGKLGISQPTFSRLISSADNVIAYGAKRDKRYTVIDQGLGFDKIPIYQVAGGGKISSFGTLRPVRGGRFVFQPMRGSNVIFDGLPWFVDCLRPQGFLGRRFAQQNPELGLPESIDDWDSRHVLKALIYRGEDLPGNLIIGSESIDRIFQLAGKQPAKSRSDYPSLAVQALCGEIPASSAGGEQPKFTCFDGERHLIVKFSPVVIGESPISRRWADLLVCEDVANKVLSNAGIASAHTALVFEKGRYFLESERFDRTTKGRLAVVPLAAIDAEFLGFGAGWSRCATQLHKEKMVPEDTLRAVVTIEIFGKMIGNTDMHLGNLSFYADAEYKTFSLAPIYDMVPMRFAPTRQGEVPELELVLPTPTPDNIDVWTQAIDLAKQFWEIVLQHEHISQDFQLIVRRCLQTIEDIKDLSALIVPKYK